MEEPILFTLEEANALLPHVRETIEIIQENKRRLDELNAEIGTLQGQTRGNGHGGGSKLSDLEHRAVVSRGMIEAKIANLRGVGCELKSIEPGLVDFPSERDGRVVYLCWQMGESTISYWHDLDAGFAGRQPL